MPPPSAHVPDLVIVTVALTSLQLFNLFALRILSPHFPTAYNSLSFPQRYEWNRRVVSLSFQCLQCLLNLHLLLYPSPITEDPLYGYSPFAHTAFLLILSFYLYDTAAYIMHPSPPSQTPIWIIHHYVAIFLLLYNVSFRQCSAFPAAAFLISAAAHIPNDIRWFMIALQIRYQCCWDAIHVARLVACILTCALPPPYLLVRCARFLGVSVWHLVTARMRFYCNFFFALIYTTHVVLCCYQARRAYSLWRLPPKPFRTDKVD